MIKVLLIFIFLTSSIYAKTNVSLNKILMKFQGDEYNILLAPKQIILSGKKKKTRKAINKGYKRAIKELKRQVKMRDMQVNFKIFTKKGSNLSQYVRDDIQSYLILKNMLSQQISIREQIMNNITPIDAPKNVDKTTSADDIDIDIDDDAFEISDDEANIESESGSMMLLSPAEAFSSAFIELSEQYNQEVLRLNKVLHPFKVKGKAVMKNVHTVFGMAFFPTKYGSIKNMKIYIVLCNINTEDEKSVQIIAKEIPNFKWDRNYLYINAATGKMLRQIISGILGKSFEGVN